MTHPVTSTYTTHLFASLPNPCASPLLVALCGVTQGDLNVVVHIEATMVSDPLWKDTLCTTCLLLSLDPTTPGNPA